MKLLRFLQCEWIFVKTEGIKDTLAVKVPPMLPLPWLITEKNVTLWNFDFTRRGIFAYFLCELFFENIKMTTPPPFDPTRFFFEVSLL